MPHQKLTLFAAFRETFRQGYTLGDLRADVLAGLAVGVIAVPLSMALAITTGVPPQYGLYSAMIAGPMAALMGGSRFNVTGPTAAFVLILNPIVVEHGLSGLMIATGMAGAILVIMGLSRMGRLIQFIPYPVTTGFTAGIAIVIASLQLKDFFGLHPEHAGEQFFERLYVLYAAAPTVHPAEFAIGLLTLAAMLLWPRLKTPVPPHLIAVTIGGLAALAIPAIWPGVQIETIGSRFQYEWNGVLHPGIPPWAPAFHLPWNFSGPGGQPLTLSLDLIEGLIGPATAIALLGAIESLLCAVVADGMGGARHNPNSELIGLGISNLTLPFFGGLTATGAIARTAANIRAGGRSPVAAVVHGVFVLLSVLCLAPMLAYLPMSALAALLLVTAWNMSDAPHIARVARMGPRSDVTVLATCITLTVVFDMVIAVGVGVVLAALLFMQRMAAITGGRWLDEGTHIALSETPPGEVMVYEIDGPLFFGAAEKAISTLRLYDPKPRAVLIDMEDVPVIDMTGLVALDSVIRTLHQDHIHVALVGVAPQPSKALKRAGIHARDGQLEFHSTLKDAFTSFKQQAVLNA
ncbi:MAG: C4-dicarboxylic acid transporter DauA [bacterium]|nr:C4-dicarboxylic acid transporter DauA [bacterium]